LISCHIESIPNAITAKDEREFNAQANLAPTEFVRSVQAGVSTHGIVSIGDASFRAFREQHAASAKTSSNAQLLGSSQVPQTLHQRSKNSSIWRFSTSRYTQTG
jgi:hypothetical protein